MPLLNTFGALTTQHSVGNNSPLSENYVRTLPVGTPQFSVTNLWTETPSEADRTSDIDSSGNLYVLSCTYSSGSVNDRTVFITKYNSNRTFNSAKSITLPTSNDYIMHVDILVDKTSGIPYIAISSNPTSYRMTLIALDTSLNVTWSKTYTVGSFGGSSVTIIKDPAQNFIYVNMSANSILIFNTSGTLLNAYDNVDVSLPLHPYLESGAGPVYISGTKLSGGRSNVTLSSGLGSITSVQSKVVTTANINLGYSTHFVPTSTIYVTYYNTSTLVSGIYSISFSGLGGTGYTYTFPDETTSLQFTGITNDGTNLYVTAISSTTFHSYVLKFDTSLNFISGIKLVRNSGTSNAFSWVPYYLNNKLYITGYKQVWVIPTDLTVPTGTFKVYDSTWTRSDVVTVTRSASTVALSPHAASVISISPTLVTQTLTSVSAMNKLIYTGL